MVVYLLIGIFSLMVISTLLSVYKIYLDTRNKGVLFESTVEELKPLSIDWIPPYHAMIDKDFINRCISLGGVSVRGEGHIKQDPISPINNAKDCNNLFKPLDKLYGKSGTIINNPFEGRIESIILGENKYVRVDLDGEEMAEAIYRLKDNKVREFLTHPTINQNNTDLIKEDGEMLYPLVNEAIETYLVNYTGEEMSNASMQNYLRRSFDLMILNIFKQNPEIVSSGVEILNDGVDDVEPIGDTEEAPEDLNLDEPVEDLKIDEPVEEPTKRKLRKS